MILLSFLKNTKVLIGIAILAVLLLGGWYVVDVIEQNGQLASENIQLEADLSNAKLTLAIEQRRFENKIKNYDDVISDYLNDVEESNQRNEKLERTIYRLSQENEELQQCMRMQLPSELIDEIFSHGDFQ